MPTPASYHRGDRRVPVSARITPEQLQRLDVAAAQLDMSRSAFIAMQIDRPPPLFSSSTRRAWRVVP